VSSKAAAYSQYDIYGWHGCSRSDVVTYTAQLIAAHATNPSAAVTSISFKGIAFATRCGAIGKTSFVRS
jgi:hypothetical protein